ncbi:MAG: OmpH family outer membrane protein [Candidatus Omnitrophica bacterium]|nr:OmpH family outer membrane protein [Candidatus Omnitrophota bacterium]
MKKILFCLVTLAVALSSVSFAKDLKIGYVDVFAVFNEYTKTKDYEAILAKKKEVEEGKLNKRKEKIEKLQNKLTLLKEEEREKEEEKIIDAAREYRKMEKKVVTDLKKERDEKMKEIIEDINKIIEKYAQKGGYDIIVNKTSVLYGQKTMDMTAQILKQANKKYKK